MHLLLPLLALLPLVNAHGILLAPPPRAPGEKYLSHCGEEIMISKNHRTIPRRTAMVTITVYDLSGEHSAKITPPDATSRKHVLILSGLIGPTSRAIPITASLLSKHMARYEDRHFERFLGNI
jgi:hypothetical protein